MVHRILHSRKSVFNYYELLVKYLLIWMLQEVSEESIQDIQRHFPSSCHLKINLP